MEEEPADYCISGGYLRVAVGDRIGAEGRYTIKRKLGYVSLELHVGGRHHSWLGCVVASLSCWLLSRILINRNQSTCMLTFRFII